MVAYEQHRLVAAGVESDTFTAVAGSEDEPVDRLALKVAASRFACLPGGECSPNDGRCNAVTGLPQLCSAEGAWQDLDACQTGQVCALSEGSASCVCRDGLDACTGGCFDLDSDSNHCGANFDHDRANRGDRGRLHHSRKHGRL